MHKGFLDFSFMAVQMTDRHTAVNLQTMITDILDKFCPGKTIAGVHDNASNMVAMDLPFAHLRSPI